MFGSVINSTGGSSTPMDSTPLLKLGHHKLNPGVAALSSPAFQEMDEYAPYRLALLLLLVASSVAMWASYKLKCEVEVDCHDDSMAYQPLSARGPLELAAEQSAIDGWENSSDSDDSAFLVAVSN